VLFLEVFPARTSLTFQAMTLVPAADRPEPGPPNGAFVIVVILNWNNLADTLECVESVLRSDYPRLAVWVVDNGSDEDPSDRLGEHFPSARVIRVANNLGYSGGNNVGLKLAMAHEAQYVLLLNNDATVAPDTITRLVAAMETDSRIGMATPRVFLYECPAEVYWDGGMIDWATGLTPHRSTDLPRSGGILFSEWLDGCCLFVRLAALHDVGLLDERYFLYYEDAEWTVRASRRGWLNAVVLDASARHKVSRSTGSLAGPLASFYFPRNRYLLLRTHGPLRTHSRPRLFYALTAYGDYRLRQSSRESRRAVLEAYWSLLRNRWGAHTPCRHRRLLALADYLLLGVTAIGRLTRRLVRLVAPSRIRAKFANTKRFSGHS
jgi:GT2 family glycosyltransferase